MKEKIQSLEDDLLEKEYQLLMETKHYEKYKMLQIIECFFVPVIFLRSACIRCELVSLVDLIIFTFFIICLFLNITNVANQYPD